MTQLQNGLYPHQVDGIEFLTQHGRAILADDMGLGKTRQAVIAMNDATPNGVVLVICHASLKLNWDREIHLVQADEAVEVKLGVEVKTIDPNDHLQVVSSGVLAIKEEMQ